MMKITHFAIVKIHK